VRYVGRTQTKGGDVSFDWSGTSFECRFTGGSLAMRVSDTKKNYYNLTVDGRDAGVVTTFGTDSVVVLAEKLGRGEHTVRMQKRTEGEQGRTTIHAFLLDRGGRLLPALPAPGRHIEFIGNSLTCGYGTEGLSKDEPFKPQTENCNKAYACIIARYFGADYTLIAHSGRGAARNYGDKNTTSQNTMADRIAVMKDGIIQQVDTPQALYHSPENLFVAGFIGSPQMNFINADVILDGEAVFLHFGECRIRVPSSLSSHAPLREYGGKQIILGLRPEDLHTEDSFLGLAAADAKFIAHVELAEMMGSEIYLHLEAGGPKLTARTPSRAQIQSGDDLQLAIDTNKLYLFDHENEQAIR